MRIDNWVFPVLSIICAFSGLFLLSLLCCFSPFLYIALPAAAIVSGSLGMADNQGKRGYFVLSLLGLIVGAFELFVLIFGALELLY